MKVASFWDILSYTRGEGDIRTQAIGTSEKKSSEDFYHCFPHFPEGGTVCFGLKLELFLTGLSHFCFNIQ